MYQVQVVGPDGKISETHVNLARIKSGSTDDEPKVCRTGLHGRLEGQENFGKKRQR